MFAPKYRRKTIYGELKKEIGKILRELCERKNIEIIEAHAMPDHIAQMVRLLRPMMVLPLPNGMRLSAYAETDKDFPAIKIRLQSEGSGVGELVAFVEYNTHNDAGKELCVGAYKSGSDDICFYEPYDGRTCKLARTR